MLSGQLEILVWNFGNGWKCKMHNVGIVSVKMALKASGLLWAHKEQESRQRREKGTKQRSLGHPHLGSGKQ